MTIAIVACTSYPTSWILATIAQIAGQITVTITIIICFYGRISHMQIVTPLLIFNIGLVFGPLLYRSLEWFERNLIFLNWQLDQELQNWKDLISALPVGIFIIRDSEVGYYNQAAKSILGLTGLDDHTRLKDSLKRIAKHSVDDNQSLYDILFSEKIDSDTMTNEKYLYTPSSEGPAAEPLLLGVSVTNLTLRAETCKVVMLQDLTVYEKLNEEKARIQYQKMFFAMITHELRNPLQGVLGTLQLLLPKQTSTETTNQCMIGLNTGKLMLCLIQDILDLSQLEANKFSLNHETFCPVAAVKECLEVMEYQFKKKEIAIGCSTLSPVPKIVNDHNRYKQIIFNLLGNALKFTKSGRVTVSLEYCHELKSLKTTVNDTGIGIKPDDLSHLFQAYGKLEAHRPNNPHGVGFGLNICKRLSEAMGGSIRVASEYGKGATFTFTIADETKDKGIISADAAEKIAAAVVPLKGKVLAVDDECMCGVVLQGMLKSLGHDTELVFFIFFFIAPIGTIWRKRA